MIKLFFDLFQHYIFMMDKIHRVVIVPIMWLRVGVVVRVGAFLFRVCMFFLFLPQYKNMPKRLSNHSYLLVAVNVCK